MKTVVRRIVHVAGSICWTGFAVIGMLVTFLAVSLGFYPAQTVALATTLFPPPPAAETEPVPPVVLQSGAGQVLTDRVLTLLDSLAEEVVTDELAVPEGVAPVYAVVVYRTAGDSVAMYLNRSEDCNCGRVMKVTQWEVVRYDDRTVGLTAPMCFENVQLGGYPRVPATAESRKGGSGIERAGLTDGRVLER